MDQIAAMVGDLRIARIEWKAKGWFLPERLIVHLPEGRRVTVPLDGISLPPAASVGLRAPGALEAVRHLVGATHLDAVLAEILADPRPTRILYDVGQRLSYVPWEVVSAFFVTDRLRAGYIPVRVIGRPQRPPPHRIAERLHVLIVLGDPGEHENRIHPQREADEIVTAWERLDPEIQARIARPEVTRLAANDLAARFRDQLVHVLWYCGHGRAVPEPGLLRAPGDWLTVKDFAALVPSGRAPLCCVLWACDLGLAQPTDVAPAPEIHRAMAACGVPATLAMQSRVRDRIARNMAMAFFAALASGMSLERAAAQSRRIGATVADNLDWASPAIWLAQGPTAALSWGRPPEDRLIERLLAWASVRGIQKNPDAAQGGPQAIEQARLWVEARRVSVRADVESEATTLALTRVADATARRFNRAPVFIRFKGADWRAAIIDWATSVLAWAEPESLSTHLGRALEIARFQPEEGLVRLIRLESALVVFIDSPEGAMSGEFVDAVRQDAQTPVVLVSPSGLEAHDLSGWERDSMLADSIAEATVLQYFVTDSPVLVAMAVLDIPLSDRELERIGFSRERFPRGTSFLFEGYAGPVLAASARRLVLNRASPDEVRAAHTTCLEILGADLPIEAEKLKLERLRHLVALGNAAGALGTARELIDAFNADDRLVSVIESYERLDSSQLIVDTRPVQSVSLFSAGLDSTCGIVANRARASVTQLVSHYSRQKSKQSKLASRFGFGPPTQARLTGLAGRGRGFFYRSFYFLCLGAAVASSYGIRRITQYENGILAIAMPPGPAYFMTRHAHPTMHRLAEQLFSAVLGGDWVIENPFLDRTKGECVSALIRTLGKAEARSVIACTETCWYLYSNQLSAKRPKGNGVPCGICVPCIVRRAALNRSEGEYDLNNPKVRADYVLARDFEAYRELASRVTDPASHARLFIELPGYVRELTRGPKAPFSPDGLLGLLRRFGIEFKNAFRP